MTMERKSALPDIHGQLSCQPLSSIDEWKGVGNPALRRRVQNRLNQRAYRRRKAKAESTLAIVPAKVDSATSATPLVINSRPEPPEWYTRHDCILRRARALHIYSYLRRSPSSDHLLCLIQFRVMDAFDTIMQLLDVSPASMIDDGSVSAFVDATIGPHPRYDLQGGCLLPTELQRTIPHHPWIDVLPFPQMRNNMLLLLALSDDHTLNFEESQLCQAMIGLDTGQSESGLILWGHPLCVESWEVAPSFLATWGWTLQGCCQLFQSTNYWRAKRGEKPLLLLG